MLLGKRRQLDLVVQFVQKARLNKFKVAKAVVIDVLHLVSYTLFQQ
jgi:hypothetical protein